MLNMPHKRLYCLIGMPRSGKDTVAKFLQESRNFEAMAFGDKIKEEFGISKEDFEAAKISGDIKELRKKLWEFSAEKKKNNPLYFIDKVLDDAHSTDKSVVITDVRTPTEYNQSLYQIYKGLDTIGIKKAFWVVKGQINDQFDNNLLKDSKISRQFLLEPSNGVYKIYNKNNSLYKFIGDLEGFFLTEDILELNQKFYQRDYISSYLNNFIVKER